MRILLITPAPPRSRAGNRATATRWAGMLRALGHRVNIQVEYHGQPADVMIALHAWRSAASIERFAEAWPDRPLVVAITGTDAYGFIHSHPDTTLRSIRLAHRLVGLHDLIANVLPENQRGKVHVIRQSAMPVAARDPYRRCFHLSVVGHLREEKDPLRPALAVRHLPKHSRIQLHQYGKATDESWAKQARAEMAKNPRYHWHEEIPHHRIRQVYRRTHALLLPSRMEGGANVISEAVVAGVPVIASNIEGSVGLLGVDYAGYYPVEDELALVDLLLRLEQDKDFYSQLEQSCLALQTHFTPEQEQAGLAELLSSLDK